MQVCCEFKCVTVDTCFLQAKDFCTERMVRLMQWCCIDWSQANVCGTLVTIGPKFSYSACLNRNLALSGDLWHTHTKNKYGSVWPVWPCDLHLCNDFLRGRIIFEKQTSISIVCCVLFHVVVVVCIGQCYIRIGQWYHEIFITFPNSISFHFVCNFHLSIYLQLAKLADNSWGIVICFVCLWSLLRYLCDYSLKRYLMVFKQNAWMLQTKCSSTWTVTLIQLIFVTHEMTWGRHSVRHRSSLLQFL